MQKFTHIIYLVIIASLLSMLWFEKNKQSNNEIQTAKVITEKVIQRTGTTNPEQQQNAETATERQREIEIVRKETKTSEDASANEQVYEREIELSLADLSPEQLDEMLEKSLNIDVIQERLLTEPVDQDWAHAMTTDITNLHAGNEELQRAKIEQISCRTTVCEIAFSATDTPFDYMMRFHSALVSQPWLTDVKSAMISNSEEQTHKIYIMRTQP